MIIALGHRQGVGKNVFAQMLANRFKTQGKEVRIAAFADALYAVAHMLYGWAGFATKDFYEKHRELKEVILPALGMSPRTLLIRLGTEAIRKKVYDQTWVKLLLHSTVDDEILIITDLRFPNEFEAVKRTGGKTIRLDRPSIPISKDVADTALAHMTEEAWDFIVTNVGTLEDLGEQAENIIFKTQSECS